MYNTHLHLNIMLVRVMLMKTRGVIGNMKPSESDLPMTGTMLQEWQHTILVSESESETGIIDLGCNQSPDMTSNLGHRLMHQRTPAKRSTTVSVDSEGVVLIQLLRLLAQAFTRHPSIATRRLAGIACMVRIRQVLDILQAATRTCNETMIETPTQTIWSGQGYPGSNDLAVQLFYTDPILLPLRHLLFTIIRYSFDYQVLITVAQRALCLALDSFAKLSFFVFTLS